MEHATQTYSARPYAKEAPSINATLRPPAEEEFALGCECADPALQIERWCVETAQELKPFN
jgi:hypothetical protein